MKKVIIVLFFSFYFLLPVSAYAQGPPVFPGDGTPEQSPIGGIAILAAAGGAYAIKKLRDRDKN